MAPETLTLPVSPLEHTQGLSGLRKLYQAPESHNQILRSNKTAPDLEEPIVRPSIKFQPDRADYEARSKKILESGKHDAALPTGFPREILGKRVWDGKSLGGVSSFAMHLSAGDIEEIESALKWFKGESKTCYPTSEIDLRFGDSFRPSRPKWPGSDGKRIVSSPDIGGET